VFLNTVSKDKLGGEKKSQKSTPSPVTSVSGLDRVF